jgi:hypothetical protein
MPAERCVDNVHALGTCIDERIRHSRRPVHGRRAANDAQSPSTARAKTLQASLVAN